MASVSPFSSFLPSLRKREQTPLQVFSLSHFDIFVKWHCQRDIFPVKEHILFHLLLDVSLDELRRFWPLFYSSNTDFMYRLVALELTTAYERCLVWNRDLNPALAAQTLFLSQAPCLLLLVFWPVIMLPAKHLLAQTSHLLWWVALSLSHCLDFLCFAD